MKALAPLLPLLFLSSCALPPTTQAQQPVVPPGGWDMGLANSGAVLYGRDGAPVGVGSKPGVNSSSGPLNHTLESNGGSRKVLLDMYQDVVDDREGLEMELALMDQERDEFLKDVNRLNARLLQLEAEKSRLATGNEVLRSQAFELAERLATAQLRRLEAEKALLERTVQDRQAAELGMGE